MNFVRERDLPTITLADGQELINYSWRVNNRLHRLRVFVPTTVNTTALIIISLQGLSPLHNGKAINGRSK